MDEKKYKIVAMITNCVNDNKLNKLINVVGFKPASSKAFYKACYSSQNSFFVNSWKLCNYLEEISLALSFRSIAQVNSSSSICD